MRLRWTNLVHLEIYELKFILFFQVLYKQTNPITKILLNMHPRKQKTTCQQTQGKTSCNKHKLIAKTQHWIQIYYDHILVLDA